MNDWHLDVALARGRVAERRAEADHARLLAAARAGRPLLRFQVRLNLEVSIGRGGQAPQPAP